MEWRIIEEISWRLSAGLIFPLLALSRKNVISQDWIPE
jgi:hypothetical protein